MIPPFEVLTGNLSGKQDLQYAKNNNPAYDAPDGKQGARNYTTRYIGAKRSDGKSFYAVRRKNTAVLNTSTRLQMALFGGAAAMAAYVFKTAALRQHVEGAYTIAKSTGQTEAKSAKAYLTEILRPGLAAKRTIISVFASDGTHSDSIALQNPWCYTGQPGGQEVKVGNAVLVKFWLQLASNPIVFTIAGMKGVAHLSDDFAAVISSRYNVLNLSTVALSDITGVKFGESYVNWMNGSVEQAANASKSVVDQDGESATQIAYFLSDTEGEQA